MCGFTVYTGSDEAIKLQIAHESYKIKHRGPDNSHALDLPRGWMMFHRLSIMDTSAAGNQPFVYNNVHLTCNGEILTTWLCAATTPISHSNRQATANQSCRSIWTKASKKWHNRSMANLLW